MTFDELKEWPLNTTRVACADGTFGRLAGFDADSECAVVDVPGRQMYRFIQAATLEPGDFETLVEMRSER